MEKGIIGIRGSRCIDKFQSQPWNSVQYLNQIIKWPIKYWGVESLSLWCYACPDVMVSTQCRITAHWRCKSRYNISKMSQYFASCQKSVQIFLMGNVCSAFADLVSHFGLCWWFALFFYFFVYLMFLPNIIECSSEAFLGCGNWQELFVSNLCVSGVASLFCFTKSLFFGHWYGTKVPGLSEIPPPPPK